MHSQKNTIRNNGRFKDRVIAFLLILEIQRLFELEENKSV